MRRRTFVVAGAMCFGFGIVMACSFPDVTFAPESNANETGTDVVTADDAATTDAVEEVILGRDDASAVKDANDCTDANCDCDDDDFFRPNCTPEGGFPDASRQPDGSFFFDCDDLDPLRNPGQNKSVKVVPVGHAGDWNCDGLVTKAFKEKGVNGNAYTCSQPLLGQCAGEGFLSAVPCGTAADFFRCTNAPLIGCNDNQYVREETQACR